MNNGWIGFDLDGTLAEYHGWAGTGIIGKPISSMVSLLLGYITNSREVRIFTARVSGMNPYKESERHAIEDWCLENLGRILPVTAEKDYEMIDLYDDRCHHVEMNTGRILG